MKQLIGVIFICLFLAPICLAEEDTTNLPGAGYGAMQWLLRPVPQKAAEKANLTETPTPHPYQVLMHNTERDAEDVWHLVSQITGDVQVNSLAAVGESLYAVFGTSHVYRMVRQAPPAGALLSDMVRMRVLRNLPVEGHVLSAVANKDGYYLIIEPQMTVQRLVDQKQTPQDSRVLLHLPANSQTWEQSKLPEAVLDIKQLQLVTMGREDSLAYVGVQQDALVCVTKQIEQWVARKLDLPVKNGTRLHWLNLQGHAIALCSELVEQKLEIRASLIVDEQVLELGQFDLPAQDVLQWAILAMGEKIGLVTQDPNESDIFKQLSLRTLDLQGQQLPEPVKITIGNPQDVLNQPGRLVVSLALMVAVMIMFSVWRRDPANAKVTVPKGYQIAAMSKRFLALMIDLAPCGMISSYFCGISIHQLIDQWPGVAVTWDQLVPGIITMTLFTTHTTLTEIFTAQTLGKKIMGISVCTMAGQSPDVWQVILRNGLKILDLVAWYVLPMLVVVSAYRQRLGDVVARTVVIQPEPSDLDDE